MSAEDEQDLSAVRTADEAAAARFFSDRLRKALAGKNFADVAIKSGIGRRSFTRYVSGEFPKVPALIAIADACDVSVEWLATGREPKAAAAGTTWLAGTNPAAPELTDVNAVAQGPAVPPPGGHRRQYVAIPRYNIQASAGGGALAEHAQVVEYLAFDVDFLRTRLASDPKHLVLIEARGDSMEPSIRDGDILTVDISPDQAVQHGQIHVVRVADDLIVKRLERRLDGGLIVHSDNPRYAPETLARDQLDTLQILGRVLLVTTPPR